MARNVDDEIKEEEEYEVEDADFLKEEQDTGDEDEDDEGENLGPKVEGRGKAKAKLEFICVSCGERKKPKKMGEKMVHHGQKMLPVDAISK